MKTEQIVILVAVAGLAVGGYLLYKKSQETPAPSPALDPNNRANASATNPLGSKVANTVDTVGKAVTAGSDMLDKIGQIYGNF